MEAREALRESVNSGTDEPLRRERLVGSSSLLERSGSSAMSDNNLDSDEEETLSRPARDMSKAESEKHRVEMNAEIAADMQVLYPSAAPVVGCWSRKAPARGTILESDAAPPPFVCCA